MNFLRFPVKKFSVMILSLPLYLELMQANNFIKATITKYKTKKKSNLGMLTPKSNLFIKLLSKTNTYLNSIIMSIGLMSSAIILGIANYYSALDWRISCIPLMISFIITSLLAALKYRFKKI
jgi:hypothetical protein